MTLQESNPNNGWLTGLALFFLVGLTIIFDVGGWWLDSGDIKKKDYEYIVLTREDSVQAIDAKRRLKYMDQIGFYTQPFPKSKQKLSKKTNSYFIFEHWYVIGILILWALDSKQSARYIVMFLFLSLGDFIDYKIHYNEDYGRPWLTYNIMFTVLYGLFLLYDVIWRRRE